MSSRACNWRVGCGFVRADQSSDAFNDELSAGRTRATRARALVCSLGFRQSSVRHTHTHRERKREKHTCSVPRGSNQGFIRLWKDPLALLLVSLSLSHLFLGSQFLISSHLHHIYRNAMVLSSLHCTPLVCGSILFDAPLVLFLFSYCIYTDTLSPSRSPTCSRTKCAHSQPASPSLRGAPDTRSITKWHTKLRYSFHFSFFPFGFFHHQGPLPPTGTRRENNNSLLLKRNCFFLFSCFSFSILRALCKNLCHSIR